MKQLWLKFYASGQRLIWVEPHGMVQPITHNLVCRKQDGRARTMWYTSATSIGLRGMVQPIPGAMTCIRWRCPSVHPAPHTIAFCLQTLEGIWNNYVDLEQKHMQVIFIIFLSTWGYNSLGDPTRQHKVWKKILLHADPIERLTVCVLSANTKENSAIQRIWPNLMWKWPKWNKNARQIWLWLYQEH